MTNTVTDQTDTDKEAAAGESKETPAKVADRSSDLYLQFPQDVMSGPDDSSERFPHSILFTLLVREKGRSSAGLKAGLNAGDAGVEVTNSGSTLSAEKGGTMAAVKTTGAAVAGAAAVGVGMKTFSAITSGKMLPTLLAGLGIGGGAMALGSKEIMENVQASADKLEKMFEKAQEYLMPTDTVLKTGKVMRLYTPQAPQEVYGASWSETELGTLLGAANSGALGETFTDTLTNLTNLYNNGTPMSGSDAGAEFAARKLAGISGITQAMGFNFNLNAAIELNTGKVPNPYKEQLFKSMNFRKFAYAFVFAPKNPSEMAQAYKIMDVFRRHMHPEKDDSGLFFHYPSLFQIEYQYKGKANTYLTKIADCALTNMDINYGANSTLTTVKGTSGAPTEIKMTLQFQELKLLDRKFFEEWGPDAVISAQTEEGLTPDEAPVVAGKDEMSQEELAKLDQDQYNAYQYDIINRNQSTA